MSQDSTRWGSLEVWIDDPQRGEPLPMNGPWSRVNSASGNIELPPELHVELLTRLEKVIDAHPADHVEDGGFEVDSLFVRTRLGCVPPYCLQCEAPLPHEHSEQDRFLPCPNCGAQSNVMPAPWWLSSKVPNLVQVVGCERTPGSYGQSALRWFVAFQGQATPAEFSAPQSEEQALAQLGIADNPKELHRALRFATHGTRKQDLQRQLDVLAQRARMFETESAKRARPWAMAAAMMAGVAAPMALFPAGVWYLARTGQLPLQGDPTLILEAISLLALTVVVPGLIVSQTALRIWGGISRKEAFNQVGFHAILSLLPALGFLVAMSRALPLLRGRLPHASIQDSDGALMRPWPVHDYVPVGWAGIPTAVILMAWGLGIQLMWLGVLL